MRVIPMSMPAKDGVVRLSATLLPAGAPEQTLWYEIPAHHVGLIPDHHDHLAVACLMLAMARRESLHIDGRLSPSLVANLHRFQHTWSSWVPRMFQHIEITADEMIEPSPPDSHQRTQCLYSGGVDALYSLHRNTDRPDLVRDTTLVMVRGMGGFPPGRPELFEAAVADATLITDALSIDLVTVNTNWEQVVLAHHLDIYKVFGAGFISCLHAVSSGYATGIVASGHGPMEQFAAGSTPDTDPLLGSDRLTIEHHGVGVSRVEKLRDLADWPLVTPLVRVCNRSNRAQRNCGKCEKCQRTALACLIADAPLVGGLPVPTGRGLQPLDFTNKFVCDEWRMLADDLSPTSTVPTNLQRFIRRRVWRADHFIPTGAMLARGLRRAARPLKPLRSAARRIRSRVRAR